MKCYRYDDGRHYPIGPGLFCDGKTHVLDPDFKPETLAILPETPCDCGDKRIEKIRAA